MSVTSTEHLERLDRILYTRPAGRNIIGFAIEEIERLRADCRALEMAAAEANALVLSHEGRIEKLQAALRDCAEQAKR